MKILFLIATKKLTTYLNKSQRATLLVFVLLILVLLFYSQVRAETLDVRRLWLPLIFKSDPTLPSGSIKNPGFEEGQVGWTFYSTQGGGDILTTAPVLRGYYSARLGSNWENYRKAYVSQQVSVPSDKSWLTFWYYIDSQETYCPQFARYDYLSVQMSGTEVDMMHLCDDDTHQNRVWRKHYVDISAYKGKNITLKMYFESDGTLPSDLYVDDFAFE
jgi:hypothetical protein